MDAVWDAVAAASENYDIVKSFSCSGIPLTYRGLFTVFYSVNFKEYKVFYRMRDNRIEVGRILMAKRDYMKILFEEPEEDLTGTPDK